MKYLNIILVTILVIILVTGCTSVKESTVKETITRDTTLTVPIPNINMRLEPIPVILPGTFGALGDSDGVYLAETYRGITKDAEATVKIYKDKQGKKYASLETKQPDIKKQITTTTITNKTTTKIEEKNAFEKMFDWIKSFIFYIVLALILIMAIPYIIRLVKPRILP